MEIQFAQMSDSFGCHSGWVLKEETKGYPYLVFNIAFVFALLSEGGRPKYCKIVHI